MTRHKPRPGDLAAKFLPHTAPFLLLDRIVAVEGATGRFVKAVASDDPLVGHGRELSPFLVVEAMAQAAGIVLAQAPELHRRSAVLAAIDQCEVTAPVRAGDLLEIEVTVVRRYATMARVRGRAVVEGRVCTTAALTLAFAPMGTVDPEKMA